MSKRVRPCRTASLTTSTGHEHAVGVVPHAIHRTRLGVARAAFPLLRSVGHSRLEQYTQFGFHTYCCFGYFAVPFVAAAVCFSSAGMVMDAEQIGF